MKNKFLLLILLQIIVLFSSVIYAQSEIPDMVTDRPDQTESASIVPIDFLQIELGFSYQKQKYSEGLLNIENDNLYLGSTLLRYGFNSNIEIRFGGEYFSRQNFVNDVKSSIQGMQNILFGAKIRLRNGEKIITNAAILLQSIIPFGHTKFRPSHFLPEIRLCLGQKITDQFSLNINVGTEEEQTSMKYFYLYTTSIGFEINERLATFIEIYGKLRKGFLPSNNFDCGLTYLHAKNIQIDFSIGTTLMNNLSDWFGGLGLSVRLPK